MGPTRVTGYVALLCAAGLGTAACTVPGTVLGGTAGNGPAVAAAAAAAVAVAVAPAPAPAAPPAGDRQTVTLVLTPPDRAGLHQLARSPGVPRERRSALLDRLRPSAVTRESVGAIARGLGLTVVNTTDSWAVTAAGSAATIRAAFGSARATDPASPWPAP